MILYKGNYLIIKNNVNLADSYCKLQQKMHLVVKFCLLRHNSVSSNNNSNDFRHSVTTSGSRSIQLVHNYIVYIAVQQKEQNKRLLQSRPNKLQSLGKVFFVLL